MKSLASIPFRAEKFPQLPLGKGSSAKPTSGTKAGKVKISVADLLAYAASVGDASVLSGGPGRPALEIIWRQAMLESSLEVHSGHFKKSSSYTRLDASEKTAVSYFLGMVQAAVMADKLLGVPTVAHVDTVLNILNGRVPKKSRPDLIGYTARSFAHGAGRVLLEAKGRTHGYDQKAVTHALGQVKTPIPEVRRLLGSNGICAASMSYFAPSVKRGTAVWHSYLEDPPPKTSSPSDIKDDEFRGIILIGQLLPIALAIRDLRELDFASNEYDGRVGARLPTSESTISIPEPMYADLIAIDGPLSNPEIRERTARNIWELVASGEYKAADRELGLTSSSAWRILGSGLAVSVQSKSG